VRELSHANVVQVHSAFWREADRSVCFVLEYMNSNSLQHILRASHGTPMAEPVVGRVLGGVLAGVEYLHSQQIIHRDLKPGNVLVHDTGEDVVVKVADYFGVTATVQRGTRGTRAYLAPEQLEAAIAGGGGGGGDGEEGCGGRGVLFGGGFD
jgi:serine/threonine protein kinase